MKVAIVGPAYPLRGGIAHHVYCLEKELTGRGHTVDVISYKRLYPRLFFPGTTEKDDSTSKLDPHALPILTPLNPITWARALKAIKAFSPDVVVFQWWQPFFAPMIGMLGRALRRNGIRCIFECHNVMPHESSPFDRLLLRFASKAADSFITHSEADRNILLALVSGKRIGVAPLPTPEIFRGGTNTTRAGRTILFFGKVRPYKGLDVLLAAMPEVLSKLDCRLTIIGEFYDSVDNCRNLIRQLGLDEHVSLEDRYVNNEEIVEIFDRVDVLVLPYREASQSAVAHIALSNALPIISSSAGGLSENIVENVTGLIFPAGDSTALADQIVSYFSNSLGPVFAGNLLSARINKNSELGQLVEDLAQSKHKATSF